MRLQRLVATSLLACAAGGFVVFAPTAEAVGFFAQAQRHDGARGDGGRRTMIREQRQQQMGQQRAQRAAQREQAAAQRAPEPPPPVAVPQQPQPQRQDNGRPGRMTPEERRALRQQINDAGRDLYRPNRP